MYAIMFATLGLGIPAACAVAILKYRLYDIDVVISKTLVYAVLAAFITAVYVLLVVGVGIARRAGRAARPGAVDPGDRGGRGGVPAGQERAQRLANRLVYGQRATPVPGAGAAVGADGRHLRHRGPAAHDGHDRRGGDRRGRADVWLRDGDVLRAVASWPADAGPGPPLRSLAARCPAAVAACRPLVAVRHAVSCSGRCR